MRSFAGATHLRIKKVVFLLIEALKLIKNRDGGNRTMQKIFIVVVLVLAGSIFAPGNAPAVCVQPPEDLISWWNGNGNADDIIGSLHGHMENGATFATGMVGQAFSFDGIDDYITVPDSSSMNLTTAFTIGAWIKVSSFTSTHATIIAKGDYTWRLQRNLDSNGLLFGTGDWSSGPCERRTVASCGCCI